MFSYNYLYLVIYVIIYLYEGFFIYFLVCIYLFYLFIIIVFYIYIYYVSKSPSSLLFLTPAQLVAVTHLKKLVCHPPINKRRRRNFHSCSIKSSEER